MKNAESSKFKKFKDNLFLSLYAWSKIPLIGFCSPRVLESDGQRTVLKIPLGFRTKNHLGAMYFGALAIGAELCIAMLAVKKIQESGQRIDFLFKDFKAEFLKRAEGDVHFICEEAEVVVDQIEQSKSSLERINRTMTAYAVVPSVNPDEKVATFTLTLSVKRRAPKT
jgi:acyl-coenzyme A thioesterase PaaI-like protein